MPAPVSAASRMPWNGTAAEPPPPPAPSLLESIPAAFRSNQDELAWVQSNRLYEAYKPVLDTLNELNPSPATGLNRYYRINGGADYKTQRAVLDVDRIWQDIAAARARDPKAFATLPTTREAFETDALTRGGQHQRDAQTAARGGIVPQLIGGVGASFTDPVNLFLTPLTGGLSAGRGVLAGMLIEGAVNAGLEGAQARQNIETRAALGETTTAGDVAMNIGTAFLFGAGLHGLARGTQAGFEKAIAANWERLPEGLRTRWTARATLDPAGEDKLLADMAEALIGPERMTEAEAGAAAELRRQAEIDAGNPFMANGAGTAAHLDALAARMAAIIHDTPSEKPAFVPGQRLGGMGDTALGTGTVAGDAQSRFMRKARVAESSGNDAAQAATSSAFGRYQFTKGTWLGYYVRRFGTGGLTREQIYAKRADPNLQDVLMADLTADNAARLSGMGAPVTEGNLYLMHLLGPTDAEKVLRAGGGTKLDGLISPGSIEANAFMAKMTAADIRAFAARKMGSAGDGGAGLHLNPALDAEAGLRAQMDAELAAVRAEAERLDAELRGRGVDTEALIREAEAADMRDAQPVPVEDIGPDALPRPLAEPRAPLERPIVPNAPAETLAIADKLKPLINDRARDINDLAGIAAELGVTPEEVRSGLLLLARDKTLVTVRKKDGAFIRRNAPSRDLSLIEWIKQGGGIWDGDGVNFKGGDLAAMGLNDWYKGGPFRDKKPIIRTPEQGPGDRSPDKILRAAVEAGYFPELRGALDAAGPDTLDTNDLLRAIEAELRGHGTRYPAGSRSYEKTAQAGGAPAPAPRGDNPYGWDAVLADTFDDLRIAAEGLGMDASLIDQDMVFYAADLRQMNPQMEPGDLFSRVINDIAEANRWDAVDESGDVRYEGLDYAWPYTSENPEPRSQAGAAAPDRGGPESIGSDPRTGGPNGGADGANGQGTPPDLADMPPEEATRFLDPTGDAAKTQIDTLEHDARMARERELAMIDAGFAENRKVMGNFKKGMAVEYDHAEFYRDGSARTFTGTVIGISSKEQGIVAVQLDGGGDVYVAARRLRERTQGATPTPDKGAAVDPNIAVKAHVDRLTLALDANLQQAILEQKANVKPAFRAGEANVERIRELLNAEPAGDIPLSNKAQVWAAEQVKQTAIAPFSAQEMADTIEISKLVAKVSGANEVRPIDMFEAASYVRLGQEAERMASEYRRSVGVSDAPAPATLDNGAAVDMRQTEIRAIANTLDQAITGKAADAITQFVGMTPGAVDRGELGGLMNARALEEAFAPDATGEALQTRQAIQAAAEPLRQFLRDRFGDFIKLYRHQMQVKNSPDSINMSAAADGSRNVLSWTSDPLVADWFAGIDGKEAKIYSEAEITKAEADYAANGEVKIGSYTIKAESMDMPVGTKDGSPVDFFNNPDNIIWGQQDVPMIYRGQEHITDTDSVRAYIEQLNTWAAETNATRTQKRARIVSAEVPISDIVWATDRAGQMEFIVRNQEGSPHFIDRNGEMQPKPTLDNGAAIDPNIKAKTRQELDLAAQQRLDGSRKTGVAQDPVMPEGLFGGPQEPTFDLGDGRPPKTMKDLLDELDADEADNATIRSCMNPKPGAGE